MRKAIGSCIRSSTRELRKLERYRQQQLNVSQCDENMDSDESDQEINIRNNFETLLDETAAGVDNNDDVDGDDDDIDKEVNDLIIEEQPEEDDDEN